MSNIITNLHRVEVRKLHKTGHAIADAISDIVGELPDGDYNIAYGVLRHTLFGGLKPWFEVDKGFWGSGHFGGNYRLAYKGTQPLWHEGAPSKPHGLELEPWRDGEQTIICPPTDHVCSFFKINPHRWLYNAQELAKRIGKPYSLRTKNTNHPIQWDKIGMVITFNSTVGVEALRRGIPVISDPNHSSIGSYCKAINRIDRFDREELFSFLAGHQFKLSDKEAINCLIKHYLAP